MNDYEPMIRRELVSDSNPYNILFEGLEPRYIMALIIGAFWNLIALWIHHGMQDDPAQVMSTIRQYFQRMRK